MSESESRKYQRKLGCLFTPIWMPLYFVSAIVGMLFEALRRGFKEGVTRAGEIMESIYQL